ncbi:MAG: type II toxin-antitoxin system VapC family toxin [Treponemataceae bacterium]|nr:type II toxin-antitoxin system VapC family toxin [Treponemataceae bacterium]
MFQGVYVKYLLDTNALIYSLCSPTELSDLAKTIITTEEDLSVSIISFWEIAIKQAIGKLNIKSSIPEIEKICTERYIKILPILSSEIENIKALPPIHKDPFDRLIISQAEKNDLCIVTSDTIIPQYNVKTAW